jgi:hypothetical protein
MFAEVLFPSFFGVFCLSGISFLDVFSFGVSALGFCCDSSFFDVSSAKFHFNQSGTSSLFVFTSFGLSSVFNSPNGSLFILLLSSFLSSLLDKSSSSSFKISSVSSF